MSQTLSVREIHEKDIDNIADYFLTADDAFLINMGVDVSKVPTRDQWHNMLSVQLSQLYPQKDSYCIIWQENGVPVGHSNVNKIIFGEEAYMHLHIWKPQERKKGLGTEFVKQTLPYYFNNLQLKNLFCEPNAHNTAPNKTLEKVGFQFVKNHITTPGWLNFEQPVNLWELSRERFLEISE
jgi:RimJ/RimL family protein N-acetyltransferase